MAALKDDAKSFNVLALAYCDKPTQVVASVKEQFTLDVTRQQVETYDPTKYAGRTLNICGARYLRIRASASAKRLPRSAFPTERIVCALWTGCEKAETTGTMPLALQSIEQASTEGGDVYVNRRLTWRNRRSVPMRAEFRKLPSTCCSLTKMGDLAQNGEQE